MTGLEFGTTMVGAVVLGAAGREIPKIIFEKIFSRNGSGNGSVKTTAELLRSGIKDDTRAVVDDIIDSKVVSILNNQLEAQRDQLETLRRMNEGMVELVTLARRGRN